MNLSRHRATRARHLACAAVGVMLLLAPAAARAASQQLTISPPIMRLTATPGQELVEDLQVTAGPDSPLTVELVHADFGFDDTSYQVTLVRDDAPETTAFSTRGWFHLPKRRYTVPKGQSRTIKLHVKVPSNTPGGTFLGAALLRVVPNDASAAGSQVQAVPESGPLLFISVGGGDPPHPHLRRFDVPKFQRSGPIAPRLEIENRGDAYFTFDGTLQLLGPGRDRTVQVGRQFVVPSQPRAIRTSSDRTGASGRPRLGDAKLGFGRYEVRARLRIDPTGKTLVETRTIWIVPTWAWVIAALVLVLAVGSIAWLTYWFVARRRELRDAIADEPHASDEYDEYDEDPSDVSLDD